VVMIVMLVSSVESFFNMNIWSSSLYFFSLNQLTTIFGGICGLYSLFKSDGTIDKIFTGGAGKNGATVAGTSVLSPASPLFLLVIPAWVIAYKSDQNVYHDHPIMYVFVFGLIGAKITNRLVVAHMCKGEITHRDASMLSPLLLIMNQYFNTVIPEIYILYFSLLWVLVDLVWYCSRVCLEICDFLEVNLFTIPYNSSGNSESHGSHSANNGHSSPQSSSSGPVTRGRKKHSRN